MLKRWLLIAYIFSLKNALKLCRVFTNKKYFCLYIDVCLCTVHTLLYIKVSLLIRINVFVLKLIIKAVELFCKKKLLKSSVCYIKIQIC